MTTPSKSTAPVKSEVETINLTPSWTAVLPMLLTAYENSNEQGRQIALEELRRMAKIADCYVANAQFIRNQTEA